MNRITWGVCLSPSDWKRVRDELEENGVSLPAEKGAAYNPKTGYCLKSDYKPINGIGQLTLEFHHSYFTESEESVRFLRFLDSFFNNLLEA